MRRELPFPDRRSGRRILTIRNFAVAVLVLAVVFALVSFRSERRPASESYGRLLERTVPQMPEAQMRQQEIVAEAPVSDETSADPMLVAAAAREAYLGTPEPLTPAIPAATPGAPLQPAPQGRESNVVVVGGSDGIAIVPASERPAPVLGGGFGRP